MNIHEIQSAISASPRAITVLYFASARTTIDISYERIPLPEAGLPLKELPKLLEERHAGKGLGKVLERCRWSVNDEMVEHIGEGEDEVVLRGGEEVAVIPPVSGG
ncbi:MoaD/ThiS [Dacryopinax primogenitus]|uniref:Molybdopterin synthase sulfur carrier subunit n=1 Tax=Dacryopinax primogenitus (strain DJM 731) TaxID=1858805 RepID=M5GG48_DACPD|nr:MoaD/ThiS [Dacryopinax primogenitus]EJU04863.1 MoaD/ThiS [Dacryopinax primogenitus]